MGHQEQPEISKGTCRVLHGQAELMGLYKMQNDCLLCRLTGETQVNRNSNVLLTGEVKCILSDTGRSISHRFSFDFCSLSFGIITS